MITTTMTPKEVLEQMLLDRPEIQRESVRYMAQGKCKEARVAKVFPLRYVHEYTATSGNHYIVMLTFNSRKDAFDFNAGLEAAAVIDTEHGKMMCGTILNMEDRHVHTFYFMPRLFKRYKERMGYKQIGIDLMRVFFKRNADRKTDEIRKITGDNARLPLLREYKQNDIIICEAGGDRNVRKRDADGKSSQEALGWCAENGKRREYGTAC